MSLEGFAGPWLQQLRVSPNFIPTQPLTPSKLLPKNFGTQRQKLEKVVENGEGEMVFLRV